MFIILYVLLALASVANALELEAWNNLTGPSHNKTVDVNLNNRCFPNVSVYSTKSKYNGAYD